MPLPDPLDPAPGPAFALALRRYRARHRTSYDYGEEVPGSQHLVHLAARSHPRQRCRRSQIVVSPKPAVRTDYTDHFGNPVSYLAVQEPHRWLEVVSEIEIEVRAPSQFRPETTPSWERLRYLARALTSADETASIGQFIFDSVLVKVSHNLREFALPSFTRNRQIGLALIDLNSRIHAEFTFDATATTVKTPLEEVLAKKRGVCQDFAHLAIGCLRSLGLPARYVSGYLRTLPPPGKPRLVGADASHAWVSAWTGGDDWLDFCPTNGKLVDADFITLAWGRDYDDVCPVRGIVLGGARQGLTVSVDVVPI